MPMPMAELPSSNVAVTCQNMVVEVEYVSGGYLPLPHVGAQQGGGTAAAAANRARHI